MATRKAILAFEGDSSDLEQTFTRVGGEARDMAADFDAAAADARGFGTAMDRAGGAAGNSESAFSGSADLLDGLGGAFGLPTEGATNLMRSFGDLSGGFSTLGPMMGQAIGWIKNLSLVTKAQTAVQWLMNAAMSANPIGLVVAAIAALVGAFILAWNHSETFRQVVTTAMDGAKVAVGWVVDRFTDLWNFIKDIPSKIKSGFSTLADIIKTPFTTAFDGVKRLWNNTIGGFSIRVPDWVPVVGGKGFDFPRMHMGGVVPGNPGQPVPVMAMAGETVGRAGAAAGGGTTVIQLVLDGKVVTEVVHDGLLAKQKRGKLGFEAV